MHWLRVSKHGAPPTNSYFHQRTWSICRLEDGLNMFFNIWTIYMKDKYINNIKKYRNNSADFQGFFSFAFKSVSHVLSHGGFERSLAFMCWWYHIFNPNFSVSGISLLLLIPKALCWVWAHTGESLGGLANHAPSPRAFGAKYKPGTGAR